MWVLGEYFRLPLGDGLNQVGGVAAVFPPVTCGSS